MKKLQMNEKVLKHVLFNALGLMLITFDLHEAFRRIPHGSRRIDRFKAMFNLGLIKKYIYFDDK